MISIMSDKVVHVPELAGADATLFAERGFNVLATANIRDRGVHNMSSALKRRFNFETVNPISDRKLEIKLVTEQTEALLREAQVPVACPPDVMDVLVYHLSRPPLRRSGRRHRGRAAHNGDVHCRGGCGGLLRGP